jgi:excisionase family DNA binding protein
MDAINSIYVKRVLTFKEACEFTALSESHMRKLCHWKQIPFSKPHGKLIYFEREKLEQWLLGNPCKTLEEQQIENLIAVTTQKKRK